MWLCQVVAENTTNNFHAGLLCSDTFRKRPFLVSRFQFNPKLSSLISSIRNSRQLVPSLSQRLVSSSQFYFKLSSSTFTSLPKSSHSTITFTFQSPLSLSSSTSIPNSPGSNSVSNSLPDPVVPQTLLSHLQVTFFPKLPQFQFYFKLPSSTVSFVSNPFLLVPVLSRSPPSRFRVRVLSQIFPCSSSVPNSLLALVVSQNLLSHLQCLHFFLKFLPFQFHFKHYFEHTWCVRTLNIVRLLIRHSVSS